MAGNYRNQKRDSQRHKVYRNENYKLQFAFKPANFEVLAQFHNQHVRRGDLSQRIEKAFDLVPTSLRDLHIQKMRGGNAANANGNRISIGPAFHTSFRVYVHELAHSVMIRAEVGVREHWMNYADKGRIGRVAWHGPEWCGVLLQLVLIIHGEESRRELSSNLKKGGCKIEHWAGAKAFLANRRKEVGLS